MVSKWLPSNLCWFWKYVSSRYVRRRLGHRKCHQKVSSRFQDHNPTPQQQSVSWGGQWRTRQLLTGSTESLKKSQCQLSVAADWSSSVDQVTLKLICDHMQHESVKKRHTANEWHICYKCIDTHTHTHITLKRGFYTVELKYMLSILALCPKSFGLFAQCDTLGCDHRCTWEAENESRSLLLSVMNGIVGKVLTINPVSVALD